MDEGHAATYNGKTPTRPKDDEYSYAFKSWDKDLSSIISSTTTKATYYAVSEDTESGWGPIR